MHSDPTPYNAISNIKKNLGSKFTRAIFLTTKYNALSFGQGSPNFELTDLLKKATDLALEDINTLDDPMNHSNRFILEQLAQEKSLLVQQELSPSDNVMVSNGATGVLTSYIYSNLQIGDEAILFEPFFLWNPTFSNAGITCKFAKPLYNEEEGGFATIDFENLRSLISPRTKLILIINPNNPDGRVWMRSELEQLAKVVEEHPQINVFSDEVYCRNIYDETEFIPFCTLPGMFERTVSNYSLGKEFFCTGWRVGVASGPSHLIKPMIDYTRDTLSSNNMLSQLTLGHAIQQARKPYKGHDTYYEWLKADFQKRKEKIIHVVKNTSKFKFEVTNPMGGYSFAVDIRKSIGMVPMKYYYPEKGIPDTEKREFVNSIEEWMTLENPELSTDEAFNEFLIIEHGIGAIPGCAFYYYKEKTVKQQLGKSFIRFSICKNDENIASLARKLA